MKAQQAIQQMADSLSPYKVIHVPVSDQNSTWVMNPQFEFICTHDGSDHTEEVFDSVWSQEREDTIEMKHTLYICDSCDQPISEIL